MAGGVPALSQPSGHKILNSQGKPPLKVPLLNLGGQIDSNKKDSFIERDSMNAGRQQINSPQISLGIDFTFNTIKNVQKVLWKNDCPWYREIKDGFSWFCYCLNKKCEVYR